MVRRGHDRPWPPGLRHDGARKGQQRRNGNDDAAVEKQTHQEYLSRVTILRTPWPMNAGFDLCRATQIATYRTFGAMIAVNDARAYLGSYGERDLWYDACPVTVRNAYSWRWR